MFELFNIPVLDEAVMTGKTIYFSHNPVNDTGFLGKELKYLLRNGYEFNEEKLIATPIN